MDNASSFVEEVHRPVRSYLISIIAAFVLILSMYFLSIWTATVTGIDAGALKAQGFPSLGLQVGGWWLGAVLSFGGMASALGLFISILLAISRVPKAMADDGLLSPSLSKIHPRYNVPHVSIIICALVVSGMVFWTFGELLIIDVTLYGAALFLEFVALIVLRRTNPDARRPFRVPLNVPGLVAMTVLPAGVFCRGAGCSSVGVEHVYECDALCDRGCDHGSNCLALSQAEGSNDTPLIRR